MPFTTVAGLSVVFCTAYYAVHHWARLKPRESILIHSGAGGLGQAVVQLARLVDAEIYVTVGNEEKKAAMVRLYGIRDDHVFYSRSSSFAKSIMRMTNGRGVDVIVNSLSGEALRSSWECIAPIGRFVEVGKKDIYAHGLSPIGGLPMLPFQKNVMFASIDLTLIMKIGGDLMRQLLREIVELAENEKIHVPQPLHVFRASETGKAFRIMQNGEHMGKIVIKFDDDDLVPIKNDKNSKIFDPAATYVIAGGLGGIGRSVACWMVDHGARNLILLSRSGSKSDAVEKFLANLKHCGANVATPPCDITD